MKTINLPRDFKNTPKLLSLLKKKPEEHWMKRGDEMVLKLFHEMAENVPAYKDFLKKREFDHKRVKNIKQFKEVPLIDKDNYLRTYKLEDLCWNGQLKQSSWVFSTTSGSTGEPFYFPRQNFQDQQYALSAEMYLLSNFEIDKKSTLYINGFAMGAWIGGLFTYEAIKQVSEKGTYNLSIINPGIFKEEIIKAVKNLGDKFDQIIIGGYPPMVKATIDEGLQQGLQWDKYNLGFIFSAEGFSEKFRDYIYKASGIKNPYKGSLNHYGTVDLGTMSHETPISILIRRLSHDNREINFSLFGEEHRQPTLTQYIPEMFYFEEVEHSIVCSAYSGLPLVRYDLKDSGGVYKLGEITQKMSNYGINVELELKRVGVDDTLWNLPFVYVFERKDFTVKLYGANIYPDSIRRLLSEEDFESLLTGKFTMIINFSDEHDQYLEINVELKKEVKTSEKLKETVQSAITKRLVKENSEFRVLYKESPKRVTPHIILWEYEHPMHFGVGGKQKWVKKG